MLVTEASLVNFESPAWACLTHQVTARHIGEGFSGALWWASLYSKWMFTASINNGTAPKGKLYGPPVLPVHLLTVRWVCPTTASGKVTPGCQLPPALCCWCWAQQKTWQSTSAPSISLSHPQNFGSQLFTCHPLKLSCSADRWPTSAARACSHQSLLSPHSDISFSGLLPRSFSHTVLTYSSAFLFSYNTIISALLKEKGKGKRHRKSKE